MTSMIRLLSILLCGAIAIAVSACAEPQVTVCDPPNGRLCPSGFHCAAAQGICIANANTICGDLNRDDGEACDDGNNVDGDGCSKNCKSTETCGNGTLDKPFSDTTNPKNEDCDTPLKVDPNTQIFCSSTCKFEQCGNMVTDEDIGEICDDGNTRGGDGCAADCKSTERCGNMIKDQPFRDANGAPDLNDPRNEVCDDGNNADGDECSADCRSTENCGNGKVDPGEECDDGIATDGSSNNADDRDCRSDCVVNRCGDGRINNNVNSQHREACDAGIKQADHNRTAVPTESAGCNIDCTAPACGDGKVNRSFKPNAVDGEQCDAGNGLNANDRDCTENCLINVCGDDHDNLIGPLHKEACDDGDRIDTNACTNECKASTCGDGILNTGSPTNEECDLGEGNNDEGACLENCLIAECGDGKLEAGVEQCDGLLGLQPCDNATCKQRTCGNGIIDPLEQCDNGPANNEHGDCRPDCIVNRCGDGYLNTLGAHTEACELLPTPVPAGNTTLSLIETATCNVNCTIPACGDNILNRHFRPLKLDNSGPASTPEQCDDGARLPDNDCSPDCQFQRCGNGIKDLGEECDGLDGPQPCSLTCFQKRCGNGIVDVPEVGEPVEECDNGDGNNDNADCRSDCVVNRCGDGHVNDSVLFGHKEACDGGPLAGEHSRIAIATDTDACNRNCTEASCGDGIVNREHKVAPSPSTLTEQCDPPGNGCSLTCRLENCGNGVTDPGEQCDDGNLSNLDDCTNTCENATCGDGFERSAPANIANKEECDDGNLSNLDDCLITCKDATCQDGFVRSDPADIANEEACDDPTLPTDCPYASAETACNVCNATCELVSGNTFFCGDGVTQSAFEVCDGGARACGACKEDCRAVFSAQATGLILAAAGDDYEPGDQFTLKDGVTSATFEFVPQGGVLLDDDNIPINVEDGNNTAAVAIKIQEAINDTTLHLSTRLVGGVIMLTHQRATSTGNQTIEDEVGTSAFAVDNLKNGQGGECTLDETCTTNLECQSNVCSAGKCTAP